jgi:hypothetical protein
MWIDTKCLFLNIKFVLHLRKHWTIWCLFTFYTPPQKTLDHLVSIHILCFTSENTGPFGVYSHFMLYLRKHWTISNDIEMLFYLINSFSVLTAIWNHFKTNVFCFLNSIKLYILNLISNRLTQNLERRLLPKWFFLVCFMSDQNEMRTFCRGFSKHHWCQV